MTINCAGCDHHGVFLVHAEESGFDWRNPARHHSKPHSVGVPRTERIYLSARAFGAAGRGRHRVLCRALPEWNPVSISGYHIREAGSTAVQELAMTLADGMHYRRTRLGGGMPVDSFAHRLSFFFNAHNDLFEEVAKYRGSPVVADVRRKPLRRREERR